MVALAALPLATRAEEPRRLAQYSHQRWMEGSEAPFPVVAMAQGRDGFLWLATGEGLFRFDGLRFERVAAAADGQQHDLPSALLVTRAGEVWTNFESTHRFAVYRGGVLRLVDGPPAQSRITVMVEGADGAIWALTANYDAEVLRYLDGQWDAFDAADGLPRSNAAALLAAADGAIWIACGTGVMRLAPGGHRFEPASAVHDARLSQDPAGRVWLSEARGSYPVTGPGGIGLPAAPVPHLPAVEAEIRGAPLFDREGNLWIATRYAGVRRFAAAAKLRAEAAGMESFTRRDGLSSDVPNQLMEDREGNVWVGTEAGVDRFHPATLIAEPLLSSPAAFGDKLLEGADGSVYIGEARTIYRVRPGGAPQVLVSGVAEPQSLCEAPDGALWIGLASEIAIWSDGRLRSIERPDRRANHNIIYDCAFDAQGGYWISAAGGGVHRYREGRWETLLEPGSRADFYPTTMVASPRGGVVVQAGDRLHWFEAGGHASTALDVGNNALKVLTLYPTADAILAAGAFGLSRLRGETVETAWSGDRSPRNRISGIVQTPAGDTWLAYPRSLVRLRPPEFERALREGAFPPPSLTLGRNDGLTSRPHSHTQRSLVRGGDGRLWVATETGTLWMDPSHIVRNAVAPGIAITATGADGEMHRDPVALELPPATSTIEIDFAISSLSDPAGVKARYRLDGFDQDWIDPGTRRQAFYTNLPPGAYRFRVVAANADGVWNREGATVGFRIPPTFYQSGWFFLLCAVGVLAVLGLAYRWRVAQLKERFRSRLEERVGERERIARELHDTLLQGVQGLILRFQAVAERISVEEESRHRLEAALVAADEVVADARDRVRDLRGSGDTGDLYAIVEQLVAAAPFDPPIPVRVVVEGRQQPLDPLVAAEILRIVREALLNIAHHARATSAEIAIGFEARYLAIRLRDDGIGLPAHVLARGEKEGHYGLLGMRERADRIGGTLAISTTRDGGTEVALEVPAELAFAQSGARPRVLLPRFLRRRKRRE